jgi:CubicO group peptidase (beta-lactamase class C family)
MTNTSFSAHNNRRTTLTPLLAGVCAAALIVWATAAPPANASPVSPGSPSPAIQELRRHMLDADVNTLTFHTMDLIFDTRSVSRSGPVWELPRGDSPLDFSYEFNGKMHQATDILEGNFTNALLILKHGEIVYEKYLNNTDAGTHFVSYSMAKSFLSTLIGLAVSDGSIHSLDDPLVKYIPELKGSGYDGVTIRQTLQMRSGVDYEERYDFGSHPSAAARVFENVLVENKERFADLAPQLKRSRPPGGAFNYSTMDTAVLGWMLERAIKRPIAGYMSERLWQPLGMQSYGFYIADGPPGIGRELSGMGYNATLRDYARFGLMMLHGGRGGPNNAQVVPAEWVKQATASVDIDGAGPTGPIKLGYGYQWWTLAGTAAYVALGLQGQFIFVDPTTQTVVVKLSFFPPADRNADGAALAFLQAASRWTPK